MAVGSERLEPAAARVDGGSAPGATAKLAAAARELVTGALPDDVATVARQCVLDWLGVTFAAAVAGFLVGMAVTTDFERALRVGMLGSLLGALIVVMTYFINAPAAGAVVAGSFGALCAAAADIIQRKYPGAAP